ncbi:MAG: hypothetical protein ACLUFI_05320 [Oscillospiraceae bacterium]
MKGTDYFTEADKQELAAAAAAQVSVPVSSVDGQTGAVSLAGTYATPADLTARLNRSTDVHAADTAYTTYMARGERCSRRRRRRRSTARSPGSMSREAGRWRTGR